MNIFKRNGIKLPTLKEMDEHYNPNPYIIAHFIHKKSGFEWFIISGTELKYDYQLFGVASVIVTELGMISLNELLSIGAELDKDWECKKLHDIFPNL